MEWIENLIPLAAVIMIFGIPIAAILTSHQRKMVELMQGTRNDVQSQNALANEVQVLRYEVAQMKEQMNQQAIQMDDIRVLSGGISGRLNQENQNGS
jgi:hypothetical protein